MPKTASDALYRELAPRIMSDLLKDFPPLADLDAAAVLGNLGHESGGFRFLQEKKPLVKGSRGGYGWAQWTGPRRKAYEAFCADKSLDPASYAANYGFLAQELSGPYKGVLPAVAAANTLLGKVKAFELGYEKAGVKNYPSRLKWAQIALASYDAANGADPALDRAIAEKLAPDIVRQVQAQLAEVGYPEIGAADGVLGDRTRAAILAFRDAQDLLPREPIIDNELRARLAVCVANHWTRPIDPGRAEKPRAEIQQSSRTMQVSWWAKIGAALGLGGSTAGNVLKAAADPDRVDAHLSVAQRVLGFVGDNWILLFGVLLTGLLVVGAFELIQRFRVEDVRTGRHF